MGRKKVGLLLAGAFVVAGGLFAVNHSFHVRAAAAASSRPALRGTDVFSRGMHRIPAFALRDQNGRLITSRSLRGKLAVITFLDSVCTKECPVAGRELAAVQHSLGPHSPLTVVVVSVDPTQDKPSTARKFVRAAGLTGQWHWLFGSERQLSPVWREYGIWVQPTKADILHTAAAYLIDRAGWMRVADGVPFIPSQLAGSVRALEDEK